MTIDTEAALARAARLAGPDHTKLVSRTSIDVKQSEPGRLVYSVRGADGVELVEVDISERTRRRIEETDQSGSAASVDPAAVPSPDGRFVARVQDGDVHVREAGSVTERRLTQRLSDAVSFGLPPDVVRTPLALRRLGMPDMPLLPWSPDSRQLLTHCIDQSDVPLAHLVDRDEQGRPRHHAYHFATPGDPLTRCRMVVLDVESGTAVELGPEVEVDFLTPLHARRAWWSRDGRTVWWVSAERGARALRLHRSDATTGLTEVVLTERTTTHLDLQPVFGATPQVRVLEVRQQLVWSSDRDGHRHLYLHDLTDGTCLRQLTTGDWVVRDIVGVDDDSDSLLVAGSGRERDWNPYFRALYRVPLSGGDPELLTPEEGDHQVTWHQEAAVLVDTWSTFGSVPLTVLRRPNGEVALELERADVTPLLAGGFTFPQEFRVIAADGVTPLTGLIYLPTDFDPLRRYAVVDSVYPGPQGARQLRVPPGMDPLLLDGAGCGPALAELGFVVIAMDGRGTPLRSRAFHEHSYGNLGSAGALEDHVAALQQLAATRPWMDVSRVGVIGHSGGGFAAARALLRFPEHFHVGVASSGNHDQRAYHAAWGETYHGLLHERDWTDTSNAPLADRLQGKLLLIHGELDDNVHPQHTLALVEALLAANKDVDLVLVPGAGHGYGPADGYVQRRQWEFLLRHLGPPTVVQDPSNEESA